MTGTWSTTLGAIGGIAMLVGLLMLVYANAGISQVHRPPPWWRRRRTASTPSGSDPAVPLS